MEKTLTFRKYCINKNVFDKYKKPIKVNRVNIKKNTAV